MATKRQIAANRRNAQKSTGPKSAAGRERSSQNAYRHGLSLRISSIDLEKQIEILARQIAGGTEDRTRLTHARDAAEAELDLQRIRLFKAAMYDCIKDYGDLEGPKPFSSDSEELRCMTANIEQLAGRGPLKMPRPAVIDPSATMSKEEPCAEPARRLLSELIKLSRYEHRAAGRRDNAIRKMVRQYKSQ
jgi:hypothetical protein